MNDMIEIQPAPERRRAFAVWAVAQTPKLRTVSTHAFAVPARLFVQAPEETLIGALVDGHRYVSPDEDAEQSRLLDCGMCYEEGGEEVHPHPECPERAAADAAAMVAAVPPETVAAAMSAAVIATDLAASNAAQALVGEQGPETVMPLTRATTEEAPEGAFPCGICEREFTSERGREAHRRQKHPEA